MLSFSLAAISILPSLVYAANDWSKPCFTGACSFDLAPSTASAGASLQINGSSASISDITPAAGWISLGSASGNGTQQTMRIVCADDDAAAAGCDHLSQNGAEDTIVRMPQGAVMPFGRIASFSAADDQTVPSSVLGQRTTNGSGIAPVVHQVVIDTNWGAADPTKNGPVSFSVQGTSPSADAISQPASRRGLGSDIGSAVSGAVDDVGSAIDDANNFNQSLSQTAVPVSFQKPFNLVDESLPCGPVTLEFKIDLNPNVTAEVDYSLSIAGTLVPPDVTQFALTSSLNADLAGDIVLTGSASGTPFDTGSVTLFQTGLPGLSLAGIIDVGPSFVLSAQATATLDVDVDLTIGLDYKLNGASFVFPPNAANESAGALEPQDAPLQLSISPEADASATISAHLIPKLQFGISALNDAAQADVFLDLDSSANLVISANATKDFSTQIGGPTARAYAYEPGSTASSYKATSAASASTSATSAASYASASYAPASYAPASYTSATYASTAYTSTSSAASSSASSSSSDDSGVDIGACISANIEVDANVGATADFFKLFNADTTLNLFSKTFQLFQKCIGSSVPVKRDVAFPPTRAVPNSPASLKRDRARRLAQIGRRATALSCDSVKDVSAPVQVIAQTILSDAIKAL